MENKACRLFASRRRSFCSPELSPPSRKSATCRCCGRWSRGIGMWRLA